MSVFLEDPIDDTEQVRPAGFELDRPRRIVPSQSLADVVFRWGVRAVGVLTLVITGAIALFLGYQLIPTLKRYGVGFFTSTSFVLENNHGTLGIASQLVGTGEVALVAVAVGFPLALLTALFISEYAPAPLKPWLVSAIDLMAAVPSIIFGAWGFFALVPHQKFVARWLAQNLAWIPFLSVPNNPNSATWPESQYVGSIFLAGTVVGLMIVPLACSVMRGVFALAPLGEREAALALGSTKWGMIRAVVLPFGRGGIIGGTMLGLGRALGETIAVLLIISPTNGIRYQILDTGGQTISSLIANDFGEAGSGAPLEALLAAGFVLFVLTLAVNTVAALFVTRSRSGQVS